MRIATGTGVFTAMVVAFAIDVGPAWAQGEAANAPQDHAHMNMSMGPPPGWVFMQDGLVTALANHQGGPRGGTDRLIAPNWWMGMATRTIGKQTLTLDAMLSLEPATIGRKGYRELFQVGEALDGAPLIDRQHPHDLFMQLAAVWRVPLGTKTGFTIAGGPAGEPALGPVAFMHRASASGLPLAPLSHHTLDSTHVSFGVVTVAVDRGRWTVEASAFNGREPDDKRWDFDFGAMDSLSGRAWFRPNAEWEVQVSTGHLRQPEQLEPGNVERSTASVSWFRPHGTAVRAVTAGYGINLTGHGHRQAVFGEFTYGAGRHSIFGRVEVVQVETTLLLTGAVPATPADEARRDRVGAFTLGIDREVLARRGFEGSLGIQATTYAVPSPLVVTHGAHPFSVQVFFRLRPPAGSMGRMWNMRMSQPMAGHTMTMPMGGTGGADGSQ